MPQKIIHKKKKERMYNVILIFLGIIGLDLILNASLQIKTLHRSYSQQKVCVHVNESSAQAIVEELQEVKEFEQLSAENGNIFNIALSTLGNTWTVDVYATGSGEIEEFNQYTIDSCGLVRCSKKMYYGNKYIRNAEENEFPCASLYDTTKKN